MTDPGKPTSTPTSRRTFLKASTTAAATASVLGVVPMVHAAGTETIRVGIIGTGGRGTGAGENILEADPNTRIVALGDTFQDRIDSCRSNLAKHGDRLDVTDDRCFVGFDAYQRVIDSDVDLVILASPPGFRPQHLETAVRAGKHIFAEKPVGVDGPGIRRVLAAYEEAKAKGLGIVAGTQRRHQNGYLESMARIHDGALGEIVAARCYWNQGALWKRDREESWSDMEWQVRNWLYFAWLSGDHIVEQHVHNIDVVNWALQAVPLRAVGMGGRQVRTDPAYGHIYDHFAIDFEYPNGVHVMSMCRQIPNCENNVSESLVGTKGRWHSRGYRFEGVEGIRVRSRDEPNPYVQEHVHLIESIRSGKPLNELKTVAESTLSAIMGRMSAYTGQAVTWEQALNSQQDLMPEELVWGPLPVPPVAMPGTTELI